MKSNSGSASPVLVGLITLVAVIGLIGISFVSMSNKEVRLRNLITAKQRDNISALDNMQKTIAQSAQIPPAAMESLKAIVVGYADARKGGSGSLATMVTEAIPNVDTSTFNNLMNIVGAERKAFATRQKELLDLGREHNDTRTVWPSSMVCGGRPEIPLQIVTSARAEGSMATGRDDDIDLRLTVPLK